MTTTECLSLIKSRRASIFPISSTTDFNLINTKLQDAKAVILPKFMIDLYRNCSGITLGSACIFGSNEINRGIKYPLPSIIQINKDLPKNKNLFGKTVFGKNDLFWFAFDTMGNCFMLDNLTLSILRKYEDPYKAIIDCLMVGKI